MSKVLELEASDTMTKTQQLNERLNLILADLKAVIDLTVSIRQEHPKDKKVTIRLWEEFLAAFFGYIKYKSKESKENLLAGISLTRLKWF